MTDGKLKSNDADLLALAISDPAAYEGDYGVPAIMVGDTDRDGDVDFDDIDDLLAMIEVLVSERNAY